MRRGLGLAVLSAGQMLASIAVLFAVWSWRAGGNSYQTGRVGAIAERLFPAFVVLASLGTALAAGRAARREGRPARPWIAAAVGIAAAIGILNHLTGWWLLGLPIHLLRPVLGEAAIAAVALAEIAVGVWLIRPAKSP
jgi:hypothetical protein